MDEKEVLRKQYLQKKYDPRMYMRYEWRHPNRPEDRYDFRTNDGKPLRYLADDNGPLNPEQWGNINILLMARGCLKTTSVLGATTWAADMWPNTETFMTAPTSDQVREFMDKFKNAISDTRLKDRRVRDRQSHQKFETRKKDDMGEPYTVYSHVKSKSAWNADEGMRGPHSHIGIIDEFQDVNEEAFSVFLEIIDQSVPKVGYFPTLFLIGTPKLMNTFFHRMWQMSNQATWDGDSEEWNEQDEVGEYAPMLTCHQCGTKMGDEGRCPSCGEYVEMADDVETFTVKGWHIDHHNSPLGAHTEDKISFKEETYSEKKFKNEVLAQFYSPEDDLLTERAIRACYDDSLGFRNSRLYEDSNVVFSIDWGGGQSEDGSETTFTVGEKRELDEEDENEYDITILNHKFLDRSMGKEEEFEKVHDWISKFRPDRVVVDEGHAGSRRERLQETYPDIVTGVGYGNVTPSEEVKWRTDDRDREVFCTVDKTYSSENMVDAFKDGKFTIPKNDLAFGSNSANGTMMISHLTAPYKEYDTTPNGRKTLKVMSDRNDDAFDTFVYQWLGHVKLEEGPSLTKLALNDRSF